MSEYKFNEDTLSEQPAIEQLKRLGHLHIHGAQLDPDLIEDCERKSRKEVILINRLNRPDIVLFINGIPVVVIECKSPVAKNKG